MKLSKQESQILMEIFKSTNGLFLFTLHRQLILSPRDLFVAVESLKSYGFVEVNEDRVNITKEGIAYAVKFPLKMKTDVDRENLIKLDYQGKKIKINEFYIPQNFEK